MDHEGQLASGIMASQVDVVNVALTLLGEQRVISMSDNIKPARDAKAIYDITRDQLLAAYNWSFAKKRARVPALVGAPEFGFSLSYQIPTDCLRLIQIGDSYVGVDLTDYRGSNTSEYEIEGRSILTNMGSPLSIKYVSRVENPGVFAPSFVSAFAAKLAESLAESLTQSDQKKKLATEAFRSAMSNAVRVNAIELAPQKLPDDEWLMSRL